MTGSEKNICRRTAENRFLQIVGWLEWLEEKIRFTFWIYVIMAVFVTGEVIFRYALRMPHDWFLEVAIVMSVYSGFLGAALTTRERGHISLDLFIARMNTKGQRIIHIINNITGILASLVLACYTVEQALFLNEINSRYSSALGTPYSIQTFGVALGLLFCAIYFFNNLIKILAGTDCHAEKKGGH